MRSTRSRVGGTTGRPSVTPFSNQTSNSSALILSGSARPARTAGGPREAHVVSIASGSARPARTAGGPREAHVVSFGAPECYTGITHAPRPLTTEPSQCAASPQRLLSLMSRPASRVTPSPVKTDGGCHGQCHPGRGGGPVVRAPGFLVCLEGSFAEASRAAGSPAEGGWNPLKI